MISFSVRQRSQRLVPALYGELKVAMLHAIANRLFWFLVPLLEIYIFTSDRKESENYKKVQQEIGAILGDNQDILRK